MIMATNPEPYPDYVKITVVDTPPSTFKIVFAICFYLLFLVATTAGVYSAIALHYSNEHIEDLEVKTNDVSYTTNVNFRARIQELEATTRKLESERYVIEVQGVEDWSEEVIKELGKRLTQAGYGPAPPPADDGDTIYSEDGKPFRVVPVPGGQQLEEITPNIFEELPTPESEKET